ncbi:MAG: hypothetical protein GF308_06580 [Candidatus Heimdallarchaeota archaeon]|nr:hypothetical protein [Candidatus Heimdallarchaeota archaeon]
MTDRKSLKRNAGVIGYLLAIIIINIIYAIADFKNYREMFPFIITSSSIIIVFIGLVILIRKKWQSRKAYQNQQELDLIEKSDNPTRVTAKATEKEISEKKAFFKSIQRLSRKLHSQEFPEIESIIHSDVHSTNPTPLSINSEQKQKGDTSSQIDYQRVRFYRGEINDNLCRICKLRLEANEEVLQCQKCHSLFHGIHLLYWLKERENCPVCGTKLKK